MGKDKNSDPYLISRVILFDDHQAFKVLVEKYQQDVKRMLLRLTAGDNHQTDDLAQETFIRAFTYIRSFKGKAQFSTWLFRIAYHVFLDAVKKKKRGATESEEIYVPDLSTNPEASMNAQMDYAQLMTLLRPPERVAIHLSYISGMSHGDIADVLDCPVGTVKTHILRGKKRIRAFLKLEL